MKFPKNITGFTNSYSNKTITIYNYSNTGTYNNNIFININNRIKTRTTSMWWRVLTIILIPKNREV